MSSWYLTRLNLTCRIGDTLALRPEGVESGTGSVWLRTGYLQGATPLDAPQIGIVVTPELLKVAKKSACIDHDRNTAKGEGFVLDLQYAEKWPPLRPEGPIDLRAPLSLSIENLDSIVKAAKAGKATSIVFYPGNPDEVVRFSLSDEQDQAVAQGAVTQVAFS